MSERHWLIIDTSASEGIRFSKVAPSDRPQLGPVHTVATEGQPTFTDVLQTYARQTGESLSNLEPLLCIAGAASGEMISLVRSNWTITRGGLSSLFGCRVRVINDVVARAWGVQSGLARVNSLRGSKPQPDFKSPGRMAMLFVGGGVGAAIVDIDREGYQRVLETESGHMDFAATTERELKVADAVKSTHSHVSWEQMLTLTRDDPAWNACPEMRDLERDKAMGEMLGRYITNLIHAHGAWNGVMLTGPRVASMTGGAAKIAFDGAFTHRRQFQRLMMQTPVWTVDQAESVLNGGAALMAVRSKEGTTRLAA
ncbi:glucokinase [Sphingomicrobium sediminis]|uniref:Glucokinase n=1 Tax=Sphingomicrobium sediminis TaxID=2950949 RepID=A0A9X2J1R4_9SPHN|nr:glucokinase [Sphingomicrobium sediminis]MCM8557528.1 glucokinase [Sphingomicrobium sediminis]